MPVSVGDLRRMVPDLLAQAGATLDQAADDVATTHGEYGRRVLAPLTSGAGWTGGGQPLAAAEVERTHRDLGDVGDVLRIGARIVIRWAGGLENLAARLRQAERVACQHGLTIGDDGAVTAVLGDLPDSAQAVQEHLAGQVMAILAEATACDDRCASELNALLGKRGGGEGSDAPGHAGGSVVLPVSVTPGNTGIPTVRVDAGQAGYYLISDGNGRTWRVPIIPKGSNTKESNLAAIGQLNRDLGKKRVRLDEHGRPIGRQTGVRYVTVEEPKPGVPTGDGRTTDALRLTYRNGRLVGIRTTEIYTPESGTGANEIAQRAVRKEGQGSDDFVIDARDSDRNKARQAARAARKECGRFENIEVIGRDRDGQYHERYPRNIDTTPKDRGGESEDNEDDGQGGHDGGTGCDPDGPVADVGHCPALPGVWPDRPGVRVPEIPRMPIRVPIPIP